MGRASASRTATAIAPLVGSRDCNGSRRSEADCWCFRPTLPTFSDARGVRRDGARVRGSQRRHPRRGSGVRRRLPTVVETNEDTCARHFAAKVHGLRVLDELVRDRPLDFMLLISSLSSVLGGLGFAAYASANAFMDAFGVRRQRTSAFPWLTINLDGWASRANEARVGDPRTLLARSVMRKPKGSRLSDGFSALTRLPRFSCRSPIFQPGSLSRIGGR